MELALKRPLDMHLHLREGFFLFDSTPISSKCFSGAVIMPNLTKPILTIEQVIQYKTAILKASKRQFTPLMTMFFSKNYSFELLQKAKEAGVFAFKLYPAGTTTNSESGLSGFNFKELETIFENMSKLNLPLLIHGETNGDVFAREKEFMPTYEALAKNFPHLRIVMEHISCKEAVETLDKFDNLFATITLHHMMLNYNDLLGNAMRPHLYCKPILKSKEDMQAIRALALNAHEKVMFGSDSAPHMRYKKYSNNTAAGIFSAPVLLPKLVEIFEHESNFERLQKFISDNAFAIHNLENIPPFDITLEKNPMKVPREFIGCVPMLAGEEISWSIKP